MAPFGIEPATFRFVAQHLNHCAAAVSKMLKYHYKSVIAVHHKLQILWVIINCRIASL